jgi:hypothetical protein
MLASILSNAHRLEDLTIGFANALRASQLFKEFTNAIGKLPLRRLHLFQLETRKEYIRRLLRSAEDTLEALTLDSITMEDEWTVPDFLRDNFLHTLKEIKFRCLTLGAGVCCSISSLGRAN